MLHIHTVKKYFLKMKTRGFCQASGHPKEWLKKNPTEPLPRDSRKSLKQLPNRFLSGAAAIMWKQLCMAKESSSGKLCVLNIHKRKSHWQHHSSQCQKETTSFQRKYPTTVVRPRRNTLWSEWKISQFVCLNLNKKAFKRTSVLGVHPGAHRKVHPNRTLSVHGRAGQSQGWTTPF